MMTFVIVSLGDDFFIISWARSAGTEERLPIPRWPTKTESHKHLPTFHNSCCAAVRN